MKTPSNELFNIIKSLTGDEKRLFKLFSKQEIEDSSYIKIFDAYESLEENDEKKFLKVLEKSGGVTNLNRVKNYLQEAVLTFLEYHYRNHSIEIQLQKLLQRTEVLYEKRLFLTAKKYIEKAEKIALDNHRYLYLLNISSWKNKILVHLSNYELFKNDKKYPDELLYIDLYKNLVGYQKLYIQVTWYIIRQAEGIDDKVKETLEKILLNPLLKNETMALSFPAKFTYCQILGDTHFLLKNWKKSCFYFQRAEYYFDSAKVSPNVRLMMLARLLTSLNKVKENEKILLVKERALQFVMSLPKKEQTTSIYTSYIALITNYIDYQLSEFNFQEAQHSSEEILKLVEKYSTTQSYMVYQAHRFLIFLLQNDYRKALSCANKILVLEKKGIRQDINWGTKILLVIVHYELGNFDLLSSLCKSYLRFFEKVEYKNDFIKPLLTFFIKNDHSSQNKLKRINSLCVLRDQLELYRIGKIMDHFDIQCWITSKIENKTLLEVMKKRKY